jgi:hypothetical protein
LLLLLLLLLLLAAMQQRYATMPQLPAMLAPAFLQAAAAFLQAAAAFLKAAGARLLSQLCGVLCCVDLHRQPLYMLRIMILQTNMQRVRLPMLIRAAAAAAAGAAAR